MVQARPHVSVCIPAYNGEQFLAETIRSVLDQTYRDFELVVLDNASSDATGRISPSFNDARVRVEINPATIPQPENWRAAVRLYRAPLIKLLCADDLLHPRCLDYQVAPMDADAGLAVVAARRHMIDEHSRALVPRRGQTRLTGVRSSVEVARRVVRSGANPIGEPGGVLFRREHLNLWMRLLQCGEFLGLPEALAAFRVAQQSLSVDNEAGVYEHQKAIMAQAHRFSAPPGPASGLDGRADARTDRTATPSRPVSHVQACRSPRRAVGQLCPNGRAEGVNPPADAGEPR